MRDAFTINVVRTPSIDAAPATPGIQTRANLLVATTRVASRLPLHRRAGNVARHGAEPQAALTVGGTFSSGPRTISATATLTPPGGAPAPTGTVRFDLYGPGDATCAVIVGTSTKALSGGGTTATSDLLASAAAPGSYRIHATYSGDANYQPSNTACNAPGSTVVAPPRRSVADFDGDGTTDQSVFRPSLHAFFAQGIGGPVPLGVNGDTPVPADYNGDGTTDRAVFHPATSQWTIEGSAPVVFGAPSDLPVPGDYLGEGRARIAVLRPSNGTWYVNGRRDRPARGLAGDIPVPATTTQRHHRLRGLPSVRAATGTCATVDRPGVRPATSPCRGLRR